MYRFSFTESVAARATEVTRESFRAIIARPDIKTLCEQVAQGQIAMKRRLPAFCWHAWFDDGQRKNSAAHPSGLIMIDVDHIDQPRALFEELKANGEKLVSRDGRLWCGDYPLLVAHITPSTHGLRLVFPVPQGLDLEQAQGYYVRALQLPNVDACTKDLARLSFCVPEGYFLYVDEEGLFRPSPQPSPVKGEGVDSAAVAQQNTIAHENAVAHENAIAQQNTVAHENTGAQQPRKDYPEYYTCGAAAQGETEEAIPYTLLVECLEELLGGVPAHGSRNNFIFSMAAYLRYVCDDDPEWIARLLPTYGEATDRWRRTIDSACQRAQYKQMPQIVKRAIENARSRALPVGETEGTADLPPQMPKKLPKLIALLTKNVPEVCRPAVANAVFPSLAAHLKDVKFWLIDGTEKEATFMCVTMAPQSSGKSAVNKPIEYITADIVERDEMSRRREQEWKDAMALKGANKEKPRRPEDLCVQVLVSDMTNAAFVQRMKDANGRYLYTNIEELDLLKQLQTNGTKDVGKIICLCFDNGKYGQERVGTQSVTGRVDLRWNWNASSTIQKGVKFFRGRLIDGTLSRINFCTIVPDKSKPFVYGRYDEQFADDLRPYIANLNLAQGYVECPAALKLSRQLLEQCQDDAALSDDDVLHDLAYRAVTIAYLKAMVLYIAHDMTWSKEIANFVQWSLEYDLWCKCHFFGQQISEDKAQEKTPQLRGQQNMLDLLPEAFTLQQAQEVRHRMGKDSNARTMLAQWTFRGYITHDDGAGVYVKTREYLKRHAA